MNTTWTSTVKLHDQYIPMQIQISFSANLFPNRSKANPAQTNL